MDIVLRSLYLNTSIWSREVARADAMRYYQDALTSNTLEFLVHVRDQPPLCQPPHVPGACRQ